MYNMVHVYLFLDRDVIHAYMYIQDRDVICARQRRTWIIHVFFFHVHVFTYTFFYGMCLRIHMYYNTIIHFTYMFDRHECKNSSFIPFLYKCTFICIHIYTYTQINIHLYLHQQTYQLMTKTQQIGLYNPLLSTSP